jgi:hypothetical protein
MKYRYTVLVMLLLAASTAFPQNIASRVNKDTLSLYLRQLTGDTPCILDGNTYTITSRSTMEKSMNYLAARYIKFRLQSYGLTVTEQPFTFSGGTEAKNVYAVQQGNKSPYKEKKLIICAHFDNVAEGRGADDNGSGTVAVLEAARIISKLKPDYTIVYALWSGEEQGLNGSAYYASQAHNNNENIAGVLNLDMIGGYYMPGASATDLAIYDDYSTTKFMTDVLSSVNVNYNIGLVLSRYQITMQSSDNYSFSRRGYPAICLIEANYHSNPNYHKSTDTYSNIDFPFFEKCSRVAVGAFAEISGAAIPATPIENNAAVPTEFALYQNYPNPFNPSTVISYSLKTAGYVNLKVFDLLGREITTLVDQYQPAGKHQALFSITGNKLSSGIYLYKLQTGNLCQIRKMVYNK